MLYHCIFCIVFSLFILTQNIYASSTIVLPITAELKHLEVYLNRTVPNILSTIDDKDKICVKPQYLKTKGIPKCKWSNGRISCESQSIKIPTVPEIKCNIQGWVKRDGNISVSGKKNTLIFEFPIKSHINIKSHIDGIAIAAATLCIEATPHIHPDWSISMDIKPTFKWSKKPTISLLNGIHISVRERVETRLLKRINLFLETLPKRLAKLKFKEKAAMAWEEVQDPILLDKKTNTYLLFIPQTLSYAGFTINDNTLETALAIGGQTHLTLGKPSHTIEKLPLVHLDTIALQKGQFIFDLPISIPYQQLIQTLTKKFPKGYQVNLSQSTMPGLLTLTHPIIRQKKTNTIEIRTQIHYESHNTWLDDINGTLTLSGIPTIDAHTQIMTLSSLHYDVQSNSTLFNTLIRTSRIDLLDDYLQKLVTFDFGSKIQKVMGKTNNTIRSISKKHIILHAKLTKASVENITIQHDKITLQTQLSGLVNAKIETFKTK